MRLWIAAAVLVGLAALGLATIPRVIDWDAYRPDIEAAASRLAGHEVVIRGPIEISLLPRPVVIARDVSMTGETEAMVGFTLRAGQADAVLAVGPLLAGRPMLRDLRLKRPTLRVEPEGSKRLLSWPPRIEDWASPFLNLDLEAIGITDGRIEFAGDRSDAGLALSDLSLQLFMNAPDGPLEAAGLFKTERHRFTLKASFGRPDNDGASPSKVTIEARNGIDETTAAHFNGTVEPFGDDRRLSGQLTLNGPDLQHGLAALSAATGQPSPFSTLAAGQPFAVRGRIDADRNGIRTDGLQIELADKRGKGRVDMQFHPQRRLDVELDLPALQLTDDAGLSNFLPLDLLSRLQVPPGRIDVGLRELTHSGQSIRQVSLKLATGPDQVTVIEQAKARLPGLIDIHFEGGLYPGHLGPALRGKLAAVGDDLGGSLTWLKLIDDVEREGNGWRSLSFESDVDVTSVEVTLSAIDMSLGSSRVQGQASLRFSERLKVSVDADVDRLNLDLYPTLSAVGGSIATFVDHLSALDAAVDLRFKRLIWQAIRVEEGSIKATAEDGRLALEQIAAKTVGKTALAIEGMVDLGQETADLSATLRSEHPVRALRQLGLDLPTNSGRLRLITLSGKAKGRLERFDLRLEAGYDGGDGLIEGRAGWSDDKPWYDLGVEARHPDHLALTSHFGLGALLPAGDAEGSFELAGKLRRDQTVPWLASGSAKLGPSTVTGSLAFQPDAQIGPWEAKVSVGTPRWDSLAPFLALAGVRLASDWTPDRWLGRLPNIGLRTGWLDDVEGTFSLASKGGLAGAGIRLSAQLSDGLLHVDSLEASPWQGKLAAELSFERRRDQPFAALDLSLTQIEASELAAWLGVKGGMEGPLDLRLEASTVGRTPYEMMAGLSGKVELTAGPGELSGLGVRTFRETMLAGDNDGRTTTDRSLSLPFEGLASKAGLSRGILTLEDGRLVVDRGLDDEGEAFSRIDGTIDLLLWIVDLTLTGAPDLAARAPDLASDALPRLYRVVGPPDRPVGFTSDGN